jgi:hypothetical protein
MMTMMEGLRFSVFLSSLFSQNNFYGFLDIYIYPQCVCVCVSEYVNFGNCSVVVAAL